MDGRKLVPDRAWSVENSEIEISRPPWFRIFDVPGSSCICLLHDGTCGTIVDRSEQRKNPESHSDLRPPIQGELPSVSFTGKMKSAGLGPLPATFRAIVGSHRNRKSVLSLEETRRSAPSLLLLLLPSSKVDAQVTGADNPALAIVVGKTLPQSQHKRRALVVASSLQAFVYYPAQKKNLVWASSLQTVK